MDEKLLSSEDSGVGLSGCSDPIVEMAMTAFTSLMLLATQIDSKMRKNKRRPFPRRWTAGKST